MLIKNVINILCLWLISFTLFAQQKGTILAEETKKLFEEKKKGEVIYRRGTEEEFAVVEEEIEVELREKRDLLNTVETKIASQTDELEDWISAVKKRNENYVLELEDKNKNLRELYFNSALAKLFGEDKRSLRLADINIYLSRILEASIQEKNLLLQDFFEASISSPDQGDYRLETIAGIDDQVLIFKKGRNGFYNFVKMQYYLLKYNPELIKSKQGEISMSEFKTALKALVKDKYVIDTITFAHKESELSSRLKEKIHKSFERAYQDKLTINNDEIEKIKNAEKERIATKEKITSELLVEHKEEQIVLTKKIEKLEKRIKERLVEADWFENEIITAKDLDEIYDNFRNKICGDVDALSLERKVILIGGDDNFNTPEPVPENFLHPENPYFGIRRQFDVLGEIDQAIAVQVDLTNYIEPEQLKCFVVNVKGRPEEHQWISTDKLVIASHASDNMNFLIHPQGKTEVDNMIFLSGDLGLQYNQDFIYSVESDEDIIQHLKETKNLSVHFQDDTAIDWIQIQLYYGE